MSSPMTASGNKGLQLEQGLIFEQDTPGATAVTHSPAARSVQ